MLLPPVEQRSLQRPHRALLSQIVSVTCLDEVPDDSERQEGDHEGQDDYDHRQASLDPLPVHLLKSKRMQFDPLELMSRGFDVVARIPKGFMNEAWMLATTSAPRYFPK